MGFLVINELCYIHDEKAHSCVQALKPGTVPFTKQSISSKNRTYRARNVPYRPENVPYRAISV